MCHSMRLSFAFLAIAIMTMVFAEDSSKKATQTAKRFEKTVSRKLQMNYLLHLPQEYHSTRDQHWPLIVFLHGSGEKGTNVSLVAKNGPPKKVLNEPHFPFILLSPQSPFGPYTWIAEDVVALIDEISSQYRVDKSRIYLTGLSMGGYGCWTLATAYPDKFAAVAPLCGRGDEVDVIWGSQRKPAAFASLPIWAFHGAKDNLVPLSESEDMVKAFRKWGCRDVQFTVYPDAGHNCWDETYANQKLYDWFLAHRRQ